MKNLTVVYTGEMEPSGQCYSRYLALKDIEPNVIPLDRTPYFRGSGFLLGLELRTFYGPSYRRLNADLLSLCRKAKPDILWVDKGYWIWPSTLKSLRSQGIYLAEHNTDYLHHKTLRMRWLYYLLGKGLPYYDHYFTTNKPDFDEISKWSRRPKAHFTHLGYDNRRFHSRPLTLEEAREWSSELLFVGHHEPRTEAGIVALIKAGLPVTVSGAGWSRATDQAALAGRYIDRYMSGDDYVRALKGAKIGLCFVSEYNANQTAARSLEIPACGTFLLAMRTRQHLDLFEEGKEAEFFENHEELCAKAKYYLEHGDERREIARRGCQRSAQSDYSYSRYMRDDWATLLKAFHASRSSARSLVAV